MQITISRGVLFGFFANFLFFVGCLYAGYNIDYSLVFSLLFASSTIVFVCIFKDIEVEQFLIHTLSPLLIYGVFFFFSFIKI